MGAMSGIKSEIEKKKRAEAAKAATREAMKRESRQAAGRDSRLEHYVGKEKAALKSQEKLAEANRDLRQG